MLKRRILKLAVAIVTIASALGLTSLGSGVTMAHASVHPAATRVAHVSPDFTCPVGYTCFFSNDDYTGIVWELKTSQYGGAVLYKFSDLGISPNPGSAHINGGSTLWVDDMAGGKTNCVYDGRIPLDHDYGYFWINYGIDTC